MASVAYFGDIAPEACHIVPTLIEEDMAGSQVLVASNIPAGMAD